MKKIILVFIFGLGIWNFKYVDNLDAQLSPLAVGLQKYRQGDLEGAISDLEVALSQDKENEKIKNYLLNCFVSLGAKYAGEQNYSKAISYLERAQRLNPEDKEIKDLYNSLKTKIAPPPAERKKVVPPPPPKKEEIKKVETPVVKEEAVPQPPLPPKEEIKKVEIPLAKKKEIKPSAVATPRVEEKPEELEEKLKLLLIRADYERQNLLQYLEKWQEEERKERQRIIAESQRMMQRTMLIVVAGVGLLFLTFFVYSKARHPAEVRDKIYHKLEERITKIVEEHKQPFRFDNQFCEKATLKDVDEGTVRWFQNIAKSEKRLNLPAPLSVKEVLTRLQLMVGDKLTNAAVLLFCPEAEKFFIQSEIRAGRFSGTDMAKDFIDMKVFPGSIIEQANLAMNFVLNNIKKSAWIESTKITRQERWEYPPEAIREAIVNAIIHRDYQSTANVQIRIFDDRLEVWNPGILAKGMSIEMLKKKHESRPFNPLLAKIFFLIRYIEQWGMGINRIISLCKENNNPEPEFELSGESFIVTLRKPEGLLKT